MKVIVVANGKGGVAKTTTSLALAAVAARSGLEVLLVDVDSQASSTDWLEQRMAVLTHRAQERGEDPPAPPFSWTHETDPENLGALRGQTGFDIAIVDTPGSLEGERVFAPVTRQADFMVLPTFEDLMSTRGMSRTVTALRRIRDVPHRVLVTASDAQNTNDFNDAVEMFKAQGTECFKSRIRSYKLYRQMQSDGSLITEVPGRWRSGANALNDYTAAWNELSAAFMRGAA